jgi:hypothetical protein
MRKLLIFGVILFSAGWAIRSTVIMHSYDNKPLGGAMVAVGFLLMGIAITRMMKK